MRTNYACFLSKGSTSLPFFPIPSLTLHLVSSGELVANVVLVKGKAIINLK